MKINRVQYGEQLARRAAARRIQDQRPELKGAASETAGLNKVAAASFAPDPSSVAKYLDQIKAMDAEELARVERFRKDIESGAYTASVNELVEPLLRFLGGRDGATPR